MNAEIYNSYQRLYGRNSEAKQLYNSLEVVRALPRKFVFYNYVKRASSGISRERERILDIMHDA